MYSTCLFCNRDLGSNRTLETFPVGRRLAFDPAKGRLWVICTHCERWNLTPLDERWEAIEQAEEQYRDARKRMSTDQIGLAKLKGGAELVRIGEPLRPEFAGWRYGDQFGRRRRRQLLIASVGVTAVGGLVIGGAVMGAGVGGFGWVLAHVGKVLVQGRPSTVVATVRTERSGIVRVRRSHLAQSSLARGSDDTLALNLAFEGGEEHIEGPEAARIASIVIPQVNRFGGNREAVADAVTVLERDDGPEGFLGRLATRAYGITEPGPRRRFGQHLDTQSGLFALAPVDRLALEMALHEETERRALEGQLTELERAWRDAEEIAAIADDMFVPDTVRTRIDSMRRSS